jgi:hypothetical protein
MPQQDYFFHPSFQITQLAESVAICESLARERFNWNNGLDYLVESEQAKHFGCDYGVLILCQPYYEVTP